MQFYSFGLGEGTVEDDTHLLGGKGAGLVWLDREGVSIPPGFIIPTTVWAEYDKKPKSTMKLIAKALPEYLEKLKEHFGYLPLLSVRSGARVSCPGMMDTILNVGIEESNVSEWVNRLGPQCFADSFKRLVVMYGSVVNGLRKSSLDQADLKFALDAYDTQVGTTFPAATAQLLGAIEAVFKSWDNERAEFYRKEHGYDRAWGTAVVVQAMVFGNLNEDSGTGVLFTRDVLTGKTGVRGEFKVNAQGEDIVAGAVTAQSLEVMKEWNPVLYDQLLATVIDLENKKRDVLDIEFTVQDEKLYLLQVRIAKRSPLAAIKIATSFVEQGLITPAEAIKRVTAKQLDEAQAVTLDPAFTVDPVFTGIAASNGVATGKPVFSREDAIKCKEPCILVTKETTPEDIAGMKAAVGVITMVGGYTSHAAVVARPMNKPCIVGVGQSVDDFKGFDVLSLDGSTGRIWTEKVPTVGGHINGTVHAFHQLVCQTLNVVPVIFDVPVHPMPEALLYLGDKVLDPSVAAMEVGKALTQVDRLYLDLIPSEAEQKFLKIVAAHDHTQDVLTLMWALAQKDPKKWSRLVVIADGHYAHGFTKITVGANLRTLVLAGPEIVLDGMDLTDPAVQRVLAWKKGEGCSLLSVGTYVPGSKSLISMEQALQIAEGA